MEIPKRCLNFRCKNKGKCHYWHKQIIFLNNFPEEARTWKVYKMCPSIYPVWCVCKRYLKKSPEPTAETSPVGFYTHDVARKVLKYLLEEVRYNLDKDSAIELLGKTHPHELKYFPENDYSLKSRYQLRPGDFTINKLGLCCGYYRKGERWIAFDNSTNNCSVEEFTTEDECLKYLKRDNRS